MFIRFVVLEKDEDSNHEMGLFQAAYGLKYDGLLSKDELKWFKGVTVWFDKHLEVPGRMSRSSRPSAHKNAISWFKYIAREHISKMWELSALLECHGINTKIIKTKKPGYIVYEDEYQITSVPFQKR